MKIRSPSTANVWTCSLDCEAIDKPTQRIVLLARKKDLPAGFSYASLRQYHIANEALLTTVHNLNVLSDFRMTLSGGRIALGLLKGLESWAKAAKADELLFHVTSGVDLERAHKFAKRADFSLIGGSYAKSTAAGC
ncbi:MAG: hypothetical protein MK180_17480 [Rhodobacteraceae bacterium]|nr:hypothetical protein [Paracoccaceae bacterium]